MTPSILSDSSLEPEHLQSSTRNDTYVEKWPPHGLRQLYELTVSKSQKLGGATTTLVTLYYDSAPMIQTYDFMRRLLTRTCARSNHSSWTTRGEWVKAIPPSHGSGGATSARTPMSGKSTVRSLYIYVSDVFLLALRTEGFRSHERFRRWKEQLVLGKRDMTMALRTFRMREDVWLWKARSSCTTAGMRSYAHKQSLFYRELAQRALCVFRADLNVSDSITSLTHINII
jgi:hypothetical protein